MFVVVYFYFYFLIFFLFFWLKSVSKIVVVFWNNVFFHGHYWADLSRHISSLILQVVEKSKESEAVWRTAALRSVLKEVHSLFVMFHGPIRVLLDREPDGGLVRCHLHSFISDYLSGMLSPVILFLHIFLELCDVRRWNCFLSSILHPDFLVRKKLQMPSFRDCLKERGTIQMLTIGREVALEVQVNKIMTAFYVLTWTSWMLFYTNSLYLMISFRILLEGQLIPSPICWKPLMP